MEKEIIIATKNRGKAKEFKHLFEAEGYTVRTLHDYPEIADIEETGTTFAENAQLKAETVSNILQRPVLADDSGLCVDALAGAPGVYSARYAGESADDALNNQKLLYELEGVPKKERTAHFHCTLALVSQKQPALLVSGKVEGTILTAPRGTDGFGYDPLFYVEDLGQTFAEVPETVKNTRSHRAIALKKLTAELTDWTAREERVSADEGFSNE